MFDFEKLANQYKLLWNRENHDRPLVTLFAPKDNIDWSAFPKAPESLSARWTDAEYLIRRHRFYMEKTTVYMGEAFPQTWVNLGPDIMGAICGCEIEFGEDTSWAVHNLEDWADFKVESDLPSSPEQPVVYSDAPTFPQPKYAFWGNPKGMVVYTGRIKKKNGKIGFVLLVNNIVKGAAGGSIQNAEAFVAHYGLR